MYDINVQAHLHHVVFCPLPLVGVRKGGGALPDVVKEYHITFLQK